MSAINVAHGGKQGNVCVCDNVSSFAVVFKDVRPYAHPYCTFLPPLKARFSTISSSPSSFHSTCVFSVVILWVAMVVVSITKPQEVKSNCHETKPDGEP